MDSKDFEGRPYRKWNIYYLLARNGQITLRFTLALGDLLKGRIRRHLRYTSPLQQWDEQIL